MEKTVIFEKGKNSEAQMTKVLLNKLIESINELSKFRKTNDSENGFTIHIADVVIDGIEYDLTIAITEKEILTEYLKTIKP